MENGDIPNEGIKASTETSSSPAKNARLNGDGKWSAVTTEVQPWIQADIQYQTYVYGLLTQGDGDKSQQDWITSFKVSTFLEDSDNEETQTFVRDEDGNIIVSLDELFGPCGFFHNTTFA